MRYLIEYGIIIGVFYLCGFNFNFFFWRRYLYYVVDVD